MQHCVNAMIKDVDFSSRASRSEYWTYMLFPMLFAMLFPLGQALAQTPEELRTICDSPEIQETLIEMRDGLDREELVVELEERCAQIDLSPTPLHETTNGSPDATHTDWVMDARYSVGGGVIVSASSDGTVALWDTETGEMVRQVEAAEEYVLSDRTNPGRVSLAKFVGDGAWIATAAWGNPVRLFDVETGEMVATLPVAPHSTFPFVIAATENGLVLVGGHDETVHVYDATTQAPLFELPGHGARAFAVAVSEGAGLIATSASRPGATPNDNASPLVQIWRLDTGEKVTELLPEGRSDAGSLAFSRNGKQLAAVADGRVYIYSVSDWSLTQTILVHPFFRVFDIAFTADGEGLITCRTHPILWDIASGERLRHFGPFADLCHSVDVSPDGRFAVTTSMGSDVRIWEIESGDFYRRLGDPSAGAR